MPTTQTVSTTDIQSNTNAEITNKKTPLAKGVFIVTGLTVIYLIWQFGFRESIASSGKNFMDSNVTIKYINMPGLSEYQAGNIQNLNEAEGQYLYSYQDTADNCTDCVEPFGTKSKVVYDGKTIYTGELANGSVLLSDNGLNYSYVVPNVSDNAVRLYVDDRVVRNSNYTTGSSLDALSNNGKDYTYHNNSDLYEDESIKYAPSILDGSFPVISEPIFNADLTDYIIGGASKPKSGESVSEAVIYDGKTLTASGQLGNTELNISENGRKYIYATNGIVNENGKTIRVSDNEDVSQVEIANDGNYSYVECNLISNASTVYIDSRPYANGNCNSSGISLSVLLSPLGNHSFYFYGDKLNDRAVLDGKLITLSGDVNGADFSGNTLYVYRWAG